MRTKDLMRNKTWWQGEVWIDEISPPEEGRQTILLKLPSGEQITAYYWFNDNVEMELDIYQIGEAYYKVRYKGESYECCPAKPPENEPVVVKTDDYWYKVNLGKCRHGILCACIQNKGLPYEQGQCTTKNDINYLKECGMDANILKHINALAEFSMTGQIKPKGE